MNDNATLTGIGEELHRLGQAHWMPVIHVLDEHYQGYPLGDERQMPSEALYLILQSLDVDDSPEERFIYRACQLDCFSYRAFYWDMDQEAVHWNPLEESIAAFKKRATNRTVHYQVDVEHPAKDIIRMWLVKRIQQ